MSKKQFFISHTAEDAPVAKLLRTWTQDVFTNRCEGFVSATYESLLPGKEWFAEIKAALRESKVFFCLLGPRSKSRPWLYFESGAAWLQEIPVVPVVHSGLKITDLRGVPLGHLHSLDLQKEDFGKDLFTYVAKTLRLGAVPTRINWDEFRSELASALADVRGPREVVSLWNDALRRGDVSLAKSVMSATTTRDDIKTWWRSLEALSKKYQAGFIFKTIHEEERIDRDAAFVSYYQFYGDKRRTLKLYRDLILLEDGEWKIAPQFVYSVDLTPAPRAGKRRNIPPTDSSTRTRKKTPRR